MWLAEAVERHMAADVVSRMREIALLMSTPPSVLEAQGITPDDIEGLLAELQVHVESIDIANGMFLNAIIFSYALLIVLSWSNSVMKSPPHFVSSYLLAQHNSSLNS